MSHLWSVTELEPSVKPHHLLFNLLLAIVIWMAFAVVVILAVVGASILATELTKVVAQIVSVLP